MESYLARKLNFKIKLPSIIKKKFFIKTLRKSHIRMIGALYLDIYFKQASY